MFEPLSPTAFGDRGVLSYSTCTARPDQVLLDSSFMLRALNPSEPGHVEAVAFLDRLDLMDTTILSTTLLELDVFDAAFDIGQDADVDVGAHHPGSSSGRDRDRRRCQRLRHVRRRVRHRSA